MDLQPIHHPEAESSSSASTLLPHSTTHQESSTSPSGEPKVLRTSARVKAAKQKSQAKGKGKDLDNTGAEEQATFGATAETSTSRNTRTATSNVRNKKTRDTSSGKGKAKETVDETPSRSNKRCVACDELNRTAVADGVCFPLAHVVPLPQTHLSPSTNQ